MQFIEQRTLTRRERIRVAQRCRQVRSRLAMRTRACGLLGCPRRVLEYRLHVLRVRGVVHELREVGMVIDEDAQNVPMQHSSARAWHHALNRKTPQLVPIGERLVVIAQQSTRDPLVRSCSDVAEQRSYSEDGVLPARVKRVPPPHALAASIG